MAIDAAEWGDRGPRRKSKGHSHEGTPPCAALGVLWGLMPSHGMQDSIAGVALRPVLGQPREARTAREVVGWIEWTWGLLQESEVSKPQTIQPCQGVGGIFS